MSSKNHDADCDLGGARNYADGACQNLAAAIAQVTGWKVALFEGAGNHVTVVTPSGQHLDIHGLRDAAEIATEWDADGPEVVGSIDRLGWLGCDVCVCDLRAAREVLERAGLLDAKTAEVVGWDIDRLVD